MDAAKKAACVPANPIVDESIGIDTWLPSLPGCNPVDGTADAAAQKAAYVEKATLVNVTSPLPAGWSNLGCYSEGNGARALQGYSTDSDDMTGNQCISLCSDRGYTLAGTEWSRQCYCGNELMAGSSNAGEPVCGNRCTGNAFEICGGSSTLTIYSSDSTSSPSSVSSASSASSASATSSSSAVSVVASQNSSTADFVISDSSYFANTTDALPTGWTNHGCYSDLVTTRALQGYATNSDSMTGATCVSLCASKGYSIAGTEWSRECYCGNELKGGSSNSGSPICDYRCSGSTDNEICGGSSTLTVYSTSSAPLTRRALDSHRKRKNHALRLDRHA